MKPHSFMLHFYLFIIDTRIYHWNKFWSSNKRVKDQIPNALLVLARWRHLWNFASAAYSRYHKVDCTGCCGSMP